MTMGNREYCNKRKKLTGKYQSSTNGLQNEGRYGPRNLRATQVIDANRKAAKMVAKDLENIAAKVDIPEAAQEGLKTLLTVIRGVASPKDKISAAGKLLEFTMSKPVAKSEVAISQAEAWLNSLKD